MSKNGYLTDAELTPIYGVQLANVTAQAFLNMSRACFAETGRYLSIALPAGGYRSFWLQGDMRTNPNRWTLYQLSPFSVIPLAQPGHSNHGLGLAVDVANWSVMKIWVLANMGRFGFSRPFGIRDPNHLLHNGRDTGPATAGGATLTPASDTKTPTSTPIKELIDMSSPAVIHIVDGAGKDAQFLAGPGIFTHYTDGKRADIQARVLGQPNGEPYRINGTEAQWVLDGFHIPPEQRVFSGGHTWDWLMDFKTLLGKK